MSVFQFIQAEFLVSICSYSRVSKTSDAKETAEEKERLGLLDKADQRLAKLWNQLTGQDDDCVAWSAGLSSMKEKNTEAVAMVEPSRSLNEEESQLCVDI